MSFFIALISSSLGLCFGPALKVLMDTAPRELATTDLLGDNLAFVANWFDSSKTVNSTVLLWYLPIIIVVASAAKAIFSFGQTFLWKRVGEKSAREIRADIVGSYLKIDPQLRLKPEVAALEENLSAFISRDIKLISDYIVNFHGNVPRESMQVVFFLIVLVALSLKLTLLFVLGIIPCLWLVLGIGRRLRKRSEAVLRDSSRLTEWLQQRLMGVETIKHYGTEAIETSNMDILLRNMENRLVKAARTSSMSSPIVETIAVVAIAGILYLTLADVQRSVTSGAVFISFFSILFMMSQSVSRLGRLFNKNRETSSAIERVEATISTFKKSSLQEMHLVSDVSVGGIKAHNISFSYENGEGGIADFSYDFIPGKIYTICGDSGAGKSTLARVMLGLYKPMQGDVRVHENLTWTYVPQALRLMPGTVADNVCFPDETMDLVRLKTALDKLDMTHVFGEEKFASAIVGDGGMQLSGGQVQRLLIARVLYHQSRYILIDEGTSALDPALEAVVLAEIKALAQSGSLVIMIAHRRAPIECADEIIMMKKGKIALSGPRVNVMNHEIFTSFFQKVT